MSSFLELLYYRVVCPNWCWNIADVDRPFPSYYAQGTIVPFSMFCNLVLVGTLDGVWQCCTCLLYSKICLLYLSSSYPPKSAAGMQPQLWVQPPLLS